MSDLTYTDGNVEEQVHWKTRTVTVPEMAYASVWVQVELDQSADPDGADPFEGPPTAESRITPVGNHKLGEPVSGVLSTKRTCVGRIERRESP